MYHSVARWFARAGGRGGKKPTDHAVLRAETCQKLSDAAAMFQAYWDQLDSKGAPCKSWLAYLSEQQRLGTWAGELELIALAAQYNLSMVILRPDKPSILFGAGKETIWLHYAKKHYTPCVPIAGDDSKAGSAARRDHVKAIPAQWRFSLQQMSANVTTECNLRGGGISGSSGPRTLAAFSPSSRRGGGGSETSGPRTLAPSLPSSRRTLAASRSRHTIKTVSCKRDLLSDAGTSGPKTLGQHSEASPSKRARTSAGPQAAPMPAVSSGSSNRRTVAARAAPQKCRTSSSR